MPHQHQEGYSKDIEDFDYVSTNRDRHEPTLDEEESYPGESELLSGSYSKEITDLKHVGGSGSGTGISGSDDGLDGKVDIAVICWSRWFFILLLFSCTVVLCGFTYATMREGETHEFEENVRLDPAFLSRF